MQEDGLLWYPGSGDEESDDEGQNKKVCNDNLVKDKTGFNKLFN